MTVYATVADVRAYGLTVGQADDARVTEDLAIASALIDAYCPPGFSTSAVDTVSVFDIRNDTVVLPTPFRNVTAVTVNGVGIDASSYIVTDFGLSFSTNHWRDADGFPLGDGLRRGLRVPRGNTVAVTATFGYDTPPVVVKRATVALACSLSTQGPSSAVASNVKSLSVEGYSVTFRDLVGAAPSDTTGNSDVDRWLTPYRTTAGVI